MDIKEQLIKEFDSNDVKVRIMQSGKTAKGIWAKGVKYVDSRAIENRLDEIFGWDGWQTKFTEIKYHDKNNNIKIGYKCTLSVKTNDGLWISKENVADATDIEGLKGGVSDSFKRTAASGYGIGRYLYKEKEIFVDVSNKQDSRYTEYAKDKKSGTTYYWAIPPGPKTITPPPPPPQATTSPTGHNVTTRPTSPKINHEQFKLLMFNIGKTMLNDEDVKEYIKKTYGLKSKKDFNNDDLNNYFIHLTNLITKKEYDILVDIAAKKGIDKDRINKFAFKQYNIDIKFVDKKQYSYIRAQLNNKPDKNVMDNLYMEGLPLPQKDYNMATPANIQNAEIEAKTLFA